MRTKEKTRTDELTKIKSLISAKYGNLKNFSNTEGISYQSLNNWAFRGLPPSLRLFFIVCEKLNLDPWELYRKIE